MDDAISIGTVRYLNARPLVFGLEDAAGVRVRGEVPSALPDLLRSGQVEAALLPSIEYFRLSADPGERARRRPGDRASPTEFVALPVGCIASRGAVGSVRLFGRVALDRVRRVLLDPASRTSNALARLLFLRRYGLRPHFVLPGEAGRGAPREPDAELVIGDAGLVAERPGAAWERDLGTEWHRFVHRPFVYAFWVARADAAVGRLVDALAAARDRGLAALEEVAGRAARASDIPEEVARRHLTEQVRYRFGEAERRGLMAFYGMAAEEGLAPEGGRLRLAPEPGEV